MAAKKKTSAKKVAPAKKKAGQAKSRPSAKKAAPKKSAARKAPARKGSSNKGSAKGGKRPSKQAPRKARRPAPRAARPVKKPTRATIEAPVNPAALALARTVAAAALDKKALDVLIIDTRARASSVGYDYVVLASGESDRQLDAISSAAEDAAKANGRRATSVESSPDWVLANFDDVVAHFFTPDKRGAYDLEGLWKDAPRVALS